MADRNDRNSKASKRAVVQAIDVNSKSRTHVSDPTHIAYEDRNMDIHHLSPKARRLLGFPAFGIEVE